LLHWVEQTPRSYLYWVARRQSLARAIWRWAYPEEQDPQPPLFDNWESLFEQLARLITDTPVTLILDEFSYAAESDSSLPSHLQAAWDHLFKQKPVTLVLSGSHIGMMVDMLGYHAPLYGRLTGQLSLGPRQHLFRPMGKLGFVERRLPVTIPLPQRKTTTRSRYHVRDPYLRFYFRFMEPNLELIEQGRTALIWERIQEQLRAFIGMTTWEELSREWILLQADQGNLPFDVELVGSHWSTDAQIDVVAINWRDKAILLGECKWGLQPVGRKVIRELIAKREDAMPKPDWQVHYAYFARAGFTKDARQEAEAINAILVDLEQLDTDLRAAMLE